MSVSPEKQKEYQKRYRESGKAKEYSKKYYEEHPEVAKKACNKYQKTDASKAYHKAYRQTEKYKEVHGHRQWVYRLRKEYGLEEKDYEEMLAVQGNCCAICGVVFSDENPPHIDHNHTTGKIRGIPCRSCNLLIGYAKENVEILSKAISYLKQYED